MEKKDLSILYMSLPQQEVRKLHLRHEEASIAPTKIHSSYSRDYTPPLPDVFQLERCSIHRPIRGPERTHCFDVLHIEAIAKGKEREKKVSIKPVPLVF